MSDVYTEQIIKKRTTAKDWAMKTGLVVAVFIVFFASYMFIVQLAFLLSIAAAYGAYWLMNFLDVEYEYSFTNGELDIDAIYGRSRRKRMFTGKVGDFELMAHIQDTAHTRTFDSAQETKDYSSGHTTDQSYAFLTRYNNKRVKIIIEPNETMLKAMATSLTPRKLFMKQQ